MAPTASTRARAAALFAKPGTYTPEVACLAAGLLLPLAFAPWHWPVLAWVALIPLFLAADSPRPGIRLRRGLLFGLGLFGLGLHWLLPTIHQFGNMPLALAVPTWVLLVAYCALYPAVFALVGGWVALRPGLRLGLALPLLWTGLEGVRGLAFTGFPWLGLGASQVGGPLDGLIPVVGSQGTGLAVALLNGWLLLAGRALARGRGRSAAAWAAGGAALVVAVLAVGPVPWTAPRGPGLEAALVQGAVPQRLKWDPEQRRETMARYRRLTLKHLDADVVVWPETSLPLLAGQARGYLEELGAAARARGTTLLVGAPQRRWVDGEKHYFNAAVTLGAGGGERYRKRHLVPFGEYVPLRGLLFFAERFVPGGGAFRPGQSPAPLAVGRHRAGIAICYEDAFAREVAATVRAGADLLVNMTNDAWFGRSIGPDQHAQLARVRARELGRPILRVANTGLTFAADHRGRVLGALPRHRPGVQRVRIQPRSGATPYQGLSRGWLLGGILLGIGVLAAVGWRGPLPGRRRG